MWTEKILPMSVTPYDEIISMGYSECNVYLAFNIGFGLSDLKIQEKFKVIDCSEWLTNRDAKFDLSFTWSEA